jgi:thioredoxin reductase
MSADLAHATLDAGLLPGRCALVVGRGRYAEATAQRLRAAGLECEIVRSRDGEAPVDEVRGERRLEAVRIGETWHEADTLVLAHRLLAAPLLLRPLGLVDGRPGIAAPVDESGATPLPGLFACGTTVRPDIDHRSSLREGLDLGRRLTVLSEAAR